MYTQLTMKTIYQVKVKINIGEVESDCYAVAHVEDDGKHNDVKRIINFESVAAFIKHRIDHPGDFSN